MSPPRYRDPDSDKVTVAGLMLRPVRKGFGGPDRAVRAGGRPGRRRHLSGVAADLVELLAAIDHHVAGLADATEIGRNFAQAVLARYYTFAPWSWCYPLVSAAVRPH